MPRLTPDATPWLGSLLLLFASACQGELEGTLDLLPERYPNRLEPSDRVVSAVMLSPPDAALPPREARAVARAAASADGPGYAALARTLVLTSPDHSEFDTSIETFCQAPQADCQALSIAGTSYSNFGDTAWLYSRVLEVYPDLTRRGYQLGAVAPVRAHAILSAYLRAFFEAALDGTPARLLEGPSPEYPEVVFH